MKLSRRGLITASGRALANCAAVAVVAVTLSAIAAPVSAQTWPDKPITFINPFPAGGGTDAFARPLAAELTKQLGQSVIIDNRGGAGGTLGAGIAARAPKDGYTFFVGAVHHSIAPAIYPKLTYDIEKDFEPISVIAVVPHVVVVNPTRVQAKSLKELIDFAKANPGKLSFGSAGNGTSHHLAGELFKILTKTDLQHIPYKGAGPALQDLIGGQIDMMFDGLGSSAAHIKGGRIAALAVASKSRSSSLPDVPTGAEGGVPGFAISAWYGVWAIAGTPKDVTARMSAEIAKALKSDAVKSVWAAQGAEVGASGPQMATFLTSEVSSWAKVAKDANIKID
ncbi:MAG: tripartite tricarboxylate transporter substrate binding protein [Hyphomicrobium aestuarii]|nr:tripartite tricarboxylate transporter substrate binding protein [Hyphomicrobium aestuarii]